MDKMLEAYDAATDEQRQSFSSLKLPRAEVERLLRKYDSLTGK
jgi:hypothetical protein